MTKKITIELTEKQLEMIERMFDYCGSNLFLENEGYNPSHFNRLYEKIASITEKIWIRKNNQ